MVGRDRAVEVRFDEDLWRREVRPFAPPVREVAERARMRLERDGLLGSEIDRHYDRTGPKGTVLPRCVKVYVPLGGPASERPFGMVLQLQADGSLLFIAFGRRHPSGGRERDVDERAHRVLHGRFPERP
ncbi:MAG: hypothetical protein ACR2K6_02920 [Solirubrobacterales bacterium]